MFEQAGSASCYILIPAAHPPSAMIISSNPAAVRAFGVVPYTAEHFLGQGGGIQVQLHQRLRLSSQDVRRLGISLQVFYYMWDSADGR